MTVNSPVTDMCVISILHVIKLKFPKVRPDSDSSNFLSRWVPMPTSHLCHPGDSGWDRRGHLP